MNFTLGDTIWAHLAHLRLLLLTQLQQVPSPASSPSLLPATATTKGNSPQLQALAVQLCLRLLFSSALGNDYSLENNVKFTVVWIFFFKLECIGPKQRLKKLLINYLTLQI